MKHIFYIFLQSGAKIIKKVMDKTFCKMEPMEYSIEWILQNRNNFRRIWIRNNFCKMDLICGLKNGSRIVSTEWIQDSFCRMDPG